MIDGRLEAFGVGGGVCHHPGAARTVQADGRPGLAGDGAQLGDGGAGPARHGQGQARIGEHGPAGGVFGTVDQGGRAVRQSGRLEGGIQGVLDDGAGGAERVGADAEHHGVAGPQHAGRVGEDVGAAFEDEADHAQRGGDLFDAPAGVIDAFDDAAPRGGGVAPDLQAGDHVGPHGVADAQAGGGAATGLGAGHVLRIGLGDLAPDGVIGQIGREGFEELGDGGVGHIGQTVEGGMSAADRAGGDRLDRGGDVQKVAGLLHDDQPVAGLERSGERLRHYGHAVAAERNRHAGDKRLQPRRRPGARLNLRSRRRVVHSALMLSLRFTRPLWAASQIADQAGVTTGLRARSSAWISGPEVKPSTASMASDFRPRMRSASPES